MTEVAMPIKGGSTIWNWEWGVLTSENVVALETYVSIVNLWKDQ